ncbi:MAG: acyl-CoA dehydrogenase family protein [Acidimicrobiales bacterium]
MDQWSDMLAVIEANRDVAERTARLAPAVLEATGRAGLWRLCAPKEVGGLELSVPEQLALCERVGRADPTVAWHLANTGATGLAAAWMPEESRAEVFAAGDRPCGGGLAPSGATLRPSGDGYVLDGAWPFMTGAADMGWCMVVARLQVDGAPPDGTPAIRRVVIPADAVEVEHTWDRASGMRGTGSHAVRVRELFVPAGRVVDPTQPPLIDRTLFRWPSSSALWACAAALCVGALRSGLHGAASMVANKHSNFDGHAHFDEARVLQTICDATAAVDQLSITQQHLAQLLWEHYERSATPPGELRAAGGRCCSQRSTSPAATSAASTAWRPAAPMPPTTTSTAPCATSTPSRPRSSRSRPCGATPAECCSATDRRCRCSDRSERCAALRSALRGR